MSQPKRLFAVYFEHKPENCPLVQATPDFAYELAHNLDEAQRTGVFSMKLHHGVDLIQADSSDGLDRVYGQILPNHLPPVITEVTDDTFLQDLFDNPKRLDNDVELRLAFLDHMADLFDISTLRATRLQDLPSNSLRKLPRFLLDNAPAA